MRRLVICSAYLALMSNFGMALRAQAVAAPSAYTVTETNAMFGPGVSLKIYRSGSKAIVERNTPGPSGGKPTQTRTLYDLQTHQSNSWDTAGGNSAPCSGGTFSGSWGDPFEDSADMSTQLAKLNAKPAGTETVHGFATKVFEAESGGARFKVWLDPKYNLAVKVQMTPAGGATQTMTDITELSVAPPPASVFALPAGCAAANAAPRVPTESERIATETGGNAQDFANASMGPGSRNSCTMLFRVVRAGSMQPITSGFQVAVDPTVDLEHPASHTIGVNTQGHSTFAGGGLREMTAQLRNGVLRIDNVPTHFDLELVFTKGESSSALIYRQCVGPQTVLLYVVKNPDKLSDGGDWLWVTAGKYATVAP